MTELSDSQQVQEAHDDRHWMQMALQAARDGLGYVEPNPLVGCALVRDGRLISLGHHAKFGQAHAEPNAIQSAIDHGYQHLLQGATAYVTLEPCCHHGKTPPCTERLIEVGISRVVVAMLDPFPAVSGQGVAALRSQGIEVELGLCESEAVALNRPYLKRLRSQRPWVIAKWAMTLDGKIATSTGHSQWISSPTSRQIVHALRGRVDAIIVGKGTALADDPMLNARLPEEVVLPRTALRVVVDSRLAIDLNSRLVNSARQLPTLIWAGPNADINKRQQLEHAGCRVECSTSTDRLSQLDQLLQFLVRENSATNVLVEGGGQLLGSFFDLQQIDQCEVFIAPKLVGGSGASSPIGGIGVPTVPDGPICTDVAWYTHESDLQITCTLDWSRQRS